MRATRNLELLLYDLKEKGPNPYIYFQLGQNYCTLNDIEKAAHYYKMGLDLNADPNASFVQSMTETYGYCLIELAKYDLAMSIQDKYELLSHRADFVYLMGGLSVYSRKGVNSYRANYNIANIYETIGKVDDAKVYYKKCGDYEPAARRLRELTAS
jgi:tetratricopeptide (TPR) repeat protein